jgi:hypothetical protein
MTGDGILDVLAIVSTLQRHTLCLYRPLWHCIHEIASIEGLAWRLTSRGKRGP